MSSENTTPDNAKRAIRIQKWTVNYRCKHKIEQATQAGPNMMTTTIMDLSVAFDCVNRKLMWATLYKTGVPIDTINHIRQGHQNTTLRCKDNIKYGPKIKNSIGVFRGSALSALLFIIYLDDVIQDYQAMNDAQGLPQRQQVQANTLMRKRQLLQKIQNQTHKGDQKTQDNETENDTN